MLKIRPATAIRIRYYRRYGAQYLRDHSFILSMAAIYVLGIWIGSRVSQALDPQLANQLGPILTGFFAKRSDQTIQQVLYSAFLSSFIHLAFLYICGFCAVAAPFILFMPFFKGMGFGITAAGMIGAYSSNALIIVMVLMLPNALISAICLFYGCREAFGFSRYFWGQLRGNSSGEGRASVTEYTVKFIIFTIILGFGAALEGILYTSFSHFFL